MNEQVNQLVMNADLASMPGEGLTRQLSSCIASSASPQP